MRGRFEVLLLHNTQRFSPCLYGTVNQHAATNRAGDVIEFTTRTYDKSNATLLARAQLFLVRLDDFAGSTPYRKHGEGRGDFLAKAALISLPEKHAFWQMDHSRFEHRWFYEPIKRPIVWHRYHEHHETTTGRRAKPPEHLAPAIEHYLDLGSVAHKDGKAALDGEVFLNRLGLKDDDTKLYTEDSRFDQ